MDNYLRKIKPAYSGYQELHVHTDGSLKDAVNSVADIFDAAETHGRNAVAITDHGNWTRLFKGLKERTKREKKILEKELQALNLGEDEIKSVLKTMDSFDTVRNPNDKMKPYIEKYEEAFVNTAKKAIQLVAGIELYQSNLVVDTDEEIRLQEFSMEAYNTPYKSGEERYHLILLAKDWVGLKALFLLSNLAQLNKQGDFPRCTMESLKLLLGPGSIGHGHVIGTSACMQGYISQTLLKPMQIQGKIEVLQEKLSLESYIPIESIEALQETIAEKEQEGAKLAEQLTNAKAAAAAIKKLDREIEKQKKAQSKIDNTTVSMFGETPYQDLELSIQKLYAEKRIHENNMREPGEVKEAQTLIKEEIKKLKAKLKGFEAINKPSQKHIVKIKDLEEELKGIGDVMEEAKTIAKQYNDIFGQGNFFIELQDHGIMEEFLLRNKLPIIAKELGIPMTVANDVHYKDASMKHKRDLIASMRFNSPIAKVATQKGNDQLYFKSNEQMNELFKDVPEAIENTSRIAEMCNVFYDKALHLPEFTDEVGGLTSIQFLSKICRENLESRYPGHKKWEKEKRDSLYQRIKYELDVIEEMGYSSYLSIVHDFIDFSKKTYGTESVGPGRGSGAGSVVCYLTGITDIDPLRYGLIFERFLNPDRVSMPDIDTDFAPSIRDGVVKYVEDKYKFNGEYPVEELRTTVCHIATEGTLAARNAIRSVGRVTGVDIKICDKVAKLIPARPGVTINEALAESEQLRLFCDHNKEIKTLVDNALLVEGMPSNSGVHAAGVIIADKPLSEYAPLFWNDKKNCWVIQYDMGSCEYDLGLLKMDFLGLKNLDTIITAKKYVGKTRGIDLDFSKIKEGTDLAVIKNVYGTGKTNGIFQFESGGMKETLKSFIPETIDDVILLNAAYRPGPMQYIPDVTDVKFGRKKAKYIVPEMENILKATYGKPIYQEQIQQVFHEVAGFSLGQADIIRRAMSKKKLGELEAAKGKFTDGFKEKGASQTDIEAFWNELLEFAKYAFNKSHAAAYSVVSFYTAYMKHHYPAEYLSSLISNSDNTSLQAYKKDAADYNVTVLPPHVNFSVPQTAPTRNLEIRLGLSNIKNVGSAASKIVAERNRGGNFKNYEDFLLRALLSEVGKGAIVSLIKSHATADLGVNRASALASIEDNIDEVKKAATAIRKNIAKEKNILAKDVDDSLVFTQMLATFKFNSMINERECDDSLLYAQEKEVVGTYVSGNPILKHKELIEKNSNVSIGDVDESREVVIAGMLSEVSVVNRKSDGKPMGKFVIDDLSGSIPGICFTYAYGKFHTQIKENAVVCIKGKITIERDDDGNETGRQVVAETVKMLA